MQPYLFPYVGYFQLIHSADKFIFLDDVNYINRGWINRNQMLMNGKATYFTVPLSKASQHISIRDTFIDYSINWREKILRSFEIAYRKAPRFLNTFPLVDEVLKFDTDRISDLAKYSIRSSCSYLGMKRQIENSSSGYNNNDLKGQWRVIDICKKERAIAYHNLIGGINIYDESAFSASKITLRFVHTTLTQYHQFKNSFVPNLSIIDLMMFLSPDELQKLLQNYELVNASKELISKDKKAT